MDSDIWFEEEILKFRDFDDAFHSSQLMIAYSYLEVTLKKICLKTEKFIDSKIGLNDLDGRNYIEKSKKFIDKILEIDTSDLNSQWEKIKVFQKIRNTIAHDNGQLSEDKKKEFQKMLKSYSGILIKDLDKSELKITNAEFVIDFCHVADDYTREIMKRIIKKLK